MDKMMMRRFLRNKFAFATTMLAFASAQCWNLSQGGGWSAPGRTCLVLEPKLVAHGPSLPPDPWVGCPTVLAHGPSLPPDPWVGFRKTVAHGPSLPPDPWVG